MTDIDHPVLFRKYLELKNCIPWTPLGCFPTPVESLDNLDCGEVWIKRDDRSSLDRYGGNKVRKLEFILADVQNKHKDHVITMGGIGTNHGLATAVYCRELGLDCTLVLFDQPVTEYVKKNLLLFRRFNARLIHTKTILRAALHFYLLQRVLHPSAYFLYAGGSNIQGVTGFVNAAFELKEQIDEGLLPEPAVIFSAHGSMGTLAGLTLGCALAGLSSRVTGVRVAAGHLGPLPVSTPGNVKQLMKETYDHLRSRSPSIPEITLPDPVILDEYFGEGYGCPTRSCMDALEFMGEREHIQLEPTYTGKAFAAVLDHCRAGGRGPILYWHTYNSVDLYNQAEGVDFHDLPTGVHYCFDND
jgi:D-cysteine desulfhydrase